MGKNGVIRVGVIGTGKHGSRYVNHLLHDIDGLELTAISRRSEEGRVQGERWNVEWFPRWEDLVRATCVDAVISVVPPFLNVRIAEECAENQKPLLLEKPLGTGGVDGARIVEVMSEAKTPLTAGQTLRFNPVIQTLKKQLPQQGRLFSIYANQRLEPSSLGWHSVSEIAGAGITIHTAVHIFDALHYITGRKIRRVMAGSYQYHNERLEDLVTILVEMDDNVVGTVDVSRVGKARSGRYEFVCENGHLYGDQVHGIVESVRGSDRKEPLVFSPVGTIVPLLEEWCEFLQGKRKNPVPGKDGLYAVRVCDSCLQSARAGTWVEI
ncbi:hypothetical protein DGMP_30190 [Desulfomarina profundi]|uniref:Gfo/Idh/MocA family oxidoreductase n=1 Tax=Desulfomarina profundi TaxID=2772557 RepID=A0A8D5FKM2_9BACT|nr:Gfo/Idh/MocA family oxidoreductase [Desulfomarina profundi]BCL62326.1 hypothetical protein DGMP_30190 [Desulfomarina profundi]